jgi:hypothetical protein
VFCKGPHQHTKSVFQSYCIQELREGRLAAHLLRIPDVRISKLRPEADYQEWSFVIFLSSATVI